MRDRVKERSSEEEREKRVDRKALQLSGKIPALGAGGPGSIPGEALFLYKEIYIIIGKEIVYKREEIIYGKV